MRHHSRRIWNKHAEKLFIPTKVGHPVSYTRVSFMMRAQVRRNAFAKLRFGSHMQRLVPEDSGA